MEEKAGNDSVYSFYISFHSNTCNIRAKPLKTDRGFLVFFLKINR